MKVMVRIIMMGVNNNMGSMDCDRCLKDSVNGKLVIYENNWCFYFAVNITLSYIDFFIAILLVPKAN